MKKSTLLALLAPTMLFSVACSGGNPGTVNSETTINVKMLLGGYGTEWMSKLIKQFETTYKDEGYKVNLLKPNRQNDGNSCYNDLLEGYKKKNVDIYFTGATNSERFYNYGEPLCEDLNELVYDQKALDFKGNEEAQTVREKLDPSFGEQWYIYNNYATNFFYMNSIAGLVVNIDKLEKCGFDYLPTTTNQFFNMIHTITRDETKVRPFTTVGNTGYAAVMINSWFRTLGGEASWDRFWSMCDADGEMRDDGYEVFNDDNLRKAAGMIFEAYDYKNFVKGAKNYSIEQAHESLICDYAQGGGVFCYDGDWALNETATNHPDEEELARLAFINVPVPSQLAINLWGSGTATNLSDEDCEKVLVKLIEMADNGKEVSEIKAVVDELSGKDLSSESILEACQARGVYNNRGVETGTAVVAKGISDTHKDIVSKFLRMIASDDFSKMYYSTSHCFSPYSKALDADTTTLLPFSQQHLKIGSHKYASTIWPKVSGLRGAIGSVLGRTFPTISTNQIHLEAEASEKTAYSDRTGDIDPDLYHVYQDQGTEIVNKNYEYCKKEWQNLLAKIK